MDDLPESREIDIHLGRRLRELRQRAGLPMSMLGEQLGLSHQQIYKYESGANRLSTSGLVRLARVLGADVPDFFEGLPGFSFSGKGAEVLQDPHSSVETVPIDHLPPVIQKRLADLVDAIVKSSERDALQDQ
ncbi:helix-turn-helix domain-containing protein [Aureimonas ureilytica]|uniref:helix-turn-helix domain-containing protein n=1 Tax=Aureimonas ureilytica TaxID=401562 RepID=UPI0007348412|nr:helix-turn-helix transcriptional regulator [Aureimonas ureilytica]